MSRTHQYQGKNLSTLILAKTERVTAMLADDLGVGFDEAYARFSTSRAFRNLQDARTLLWAESAGFIRDDYLRELVADERREA